LCSLYACDQTDLKLYLVLDYVPGGELFKRLDDAQDLSEEDARFYAAEVIVALEHLHSLDIIYRYSSQSLGLVAPQG